jgi:hypothetical protein
MVFQRWGNAFIGAMRCMPLQNAMRWFVSLTMTLVFHGFSTLGQCIYRRMALHANAECGEVVRGIYP